MEVATTLDYNRDNIDTYKLKDDLLYLDDSLNNIITKEGFKTYKVCKRQISTDGGNYLGVLYEVDVTGKTDDGDKETNIFIKKIIPGDNMKVISISIAYSKELFAYNELSKIFIDLQNKANIPQTERFKMAKSFDECNEELIVLENLSKKGFVTGYRMDVMSLEFAELSTQQLARFHALSYVLQIKNPEYFNRKMRTLQQPYIFGDDFNGFVNNSGKTVLEAFDDPDDVRRLKMFNPKMVDKLKDYMINNTMRGCCVCHGDYRNNNILMRNENGVTQEVVPIDYQLLYYGCPLNDFLYFIFTGTDQKFRKNHLDDLKDLYFNTLEKFLKYFDIKVEDIYSRKEFEKEYERRLDFGLIVAIFSLPFVFADNDDIPDVTKDDLSNLHVKMNDKFVDRIRGVVDDFKNWGYL